MEGELKKAARRVGSAGQHFISIRDACLRFGISRSAVFALIRQHHIQRYRKPFDSRTYLRIEDVEAVRTKMPSQRRALITPQADDDQSAETHQGGH